MKRTKTFLTGCDVHDKTLVTQTAVDLESPELKRWTNRREGREKLIHYLKERARRKGAKRIVFVYEASGFGFGLHDELKEAGIECFVLAPTKIRKSPKERKDKSDAKDALRLLEILRGHVLAGNELPAVWVPDPTTRDDREPVRARVDIGKKITCVKTQILSLLRRNGVEGREAVGKPWVRSFLQWVTDLATGDEPGLGEGAGGVLCSLLRQLMFWQTEQNHLDQAVTRLSREKRYAGRVQALTSEMGVGLLTAMVFLTELGDMRRFRNRRNVGAYLGLAPSAFESGEASDRKGHISREGPGRVRKVLCQAVWYRVRRHAGERAAFQRMVRRNPKKKKISIVAMMRRLSIRLWHLASTKETRKKAA